MSHISRVKTQVKDFDVFRKVMDQMGAELVVGENLRTRTPWNSEPVDMIINPKGCPERNKGFMGAKWNGDNLELVGDSYGVYLEDATNRNRPYGGGHFSMEEFNQEMTRQYGKEKVIKEFQMDPDLSAFSYTEETNEKGEIVLRFTRW